MAVPDIETLDAIAKLIAGDSAWFNDLGPESRVKVIGLAAQCELVDMVREANSKLINKLRDIEQSLDNMASDTKVIADWFNRSTPYSSY